MGSDWPGHKNKLASSSWQAGALLDDDHVDDDDDDHDHDDGDDDDDDDEDGGGFCGSIWNPDSGYPISNCIIMILMIVWKILNMV